jgi:hypothetical protein
MSDPNSLQFILEQVIEDDMQWNLVWQRTPYNTPAWFTQEHHQTPTPYRPMSLCEIRFRLSQIDYRVTIAELRAQLELLNDPFLNFR